MINVRRKNISYEVKATPTSTENLWSVIDDTFKAIGGRLVIWLPAARTQDCTIVEFDDSESPVIAADNKDYFIGPIDFSDESHTPKYIKSAGTDETLTIQLQLYA